MGQACYNTEMNKNFDGTLFILMNGPCVKIPQCEISFRPLGSQWLKVDYFEPRVVFYVPL